MRWSDLDGKRLLIVGTGREGRALADRLAPTGAVLRAADDRDGEAAAAWRERWSDRVPLTVAPTAADLAGVDAAILSPGIPPHADVRRLLDALGIPQTTATDLWLGDHAARTTAVTGSKGKSTTASLIHALLAAHDVDAQLGGNIGIPLLSLPPATRYVAELSSYQSSSVTTSPDVVVLTALFPEHLDWHGGEQQYYAAKLNLAAHGARRVVANPDDERLRLLVAQLLPSVEPVPLVWTLDDHDLLRDGAVVMPRADITLRGRHNHGNILLALQSVEESAESGLALDLDVVRSTLAAFQPLEHRLEPIAEPETGLTFVDDSLSTNPQAAVAALEALDRDDIVLLVGGADRGVDYAPLAARLAAHPIAGLVGLPDSGARLVGELAAPGMAVVAADGMPAAVAAARELVPAGGIVLLSPAAPSYGRYRDYADRAADFRRAIAATLAPDTTTTTR